MYYETVKKTSVINFKFIKINKGI